MRYFKAIALQGKPFIQWALWAKDEEELQKYDQAERALIVAENEIPDFQFGVCPLEIVETHGGASLQQRGNMRQYESEYSAVLIERQKTKLYAELKDLHFEIQFKTLLKEDTSGLERMQTAKLAEYESLKNEAINNA